MWSRGDKAVKMKQGLLLRVNKAAHVVRSWKIFETSISDFQFQKLAINEWGWVGYEEFCRSASVDNTLQDLHNSLYPTKAEFINIALLFLQQNS